MARHDGVTVCYLMYDGYTDVQGTIDIDYPYRMRVALETYGPDFHECPDPELAKDRWHRQFIDGLRRAINGEGKGWSMDDEYRELSRLLYGTDEIDSKTTIDEAVRMIALNSGCTAKGVEKAILRTMTMLIKNSRTREDATNG